MPGNTILINGSWREYYLGDSNMDELLETLNTKGLLMQEHGRDLPEPWKPVGHEEPRCIVTPLLGRKGGKKK